MIGCRLPAGHVRGAAMWVVAASLASAACGEGMPDGDAPVRTDSAGIEIVVNAAGDRPLDRRFEEVLRLGGADDGPETFFRVGPGSVAFDARGRIFILDTGNRRVRIFDADGSHVRSFGQEGEGPGELQLPANLALLPSGDVAVHDVRQRAILRFDTVGTFLGEEPAPPGVMGGVHAIGEERLYATRRREDGDEPRVRREYMALHRVGADDTTEIVEARMPDVTSVMYESCGVSLSISPLFANRPDWAAGSDGRVALGNGPDYDVRIFEGVSEVRRVRRAIEPPEATIEIARAQLGEGSEWIIGDRPCLVPTDEVLEKRGIADRVSLVGSVALLPDGELWVRRGTVGEGPGPVDVFDGTGTYLGTMPGEVPWPAAVAPDGRILAVERDELGVEYVVIYRRVDASEG